MSSHDKLSLFLLEQQADRQEQVDEMDYFKRTLHMRDYRNLKENTDLKTI